MAEPASLVHLELHTPNPTDACGFYGALCGWRGERVCTAAGSYLALDLGSSIGGGVVPSPVEQPLWLPYLSVRDLPAALERAQLLGARVLLGAREGPAGWRAVIATPAGGAVAFWQPKS